MKIIKIARQFGLGLLFVTFTSGQTWAEQSTLVQSGNWRMVKSSNATTASCSAEVTDGAKTTFYLVANSNKANSVMLRAVGGSWGVVNAQNGYKNYQIQAAPGNLRVIRGARMHSGEWTYLLPHQPWSINFLAEVAHGTSLTLFEIRERIIFQIDIRGAEPVIASFIECSNSIWQTQ